MPEEHNAMEALAAQVRVALEGADLAAFGHLLDPGVRWGAPDSRRPSCRNRDQVLRWYERGRESGVRATVDEVVVLGDRLLVGLRVQRPSESETDTSETDSPEGAQPRWQVLTVRAGKVVDIVGFDDRTEALARAEASTL